MASQFVFLNYGMKNGSSFNEYGWISEDKESANKLIEHCKEEYLFFSLLKNNLYSTSSFSIQGINLTVHSIGAHRALSFELPEDPPPSEKTIQLFDAIRADAKMIVDIDYHWRLNNCVMAVAKILNTLDSTVIPKGVNMPWEMDNGIKRYCGWYPENTTKGVFIRQYQKIVDNTKEDSPYWSVNKRRIESLHDIFINADSPARGEITRITLLKLGWIQLDKNRMMTPTEQAPEDFKNALEAYNNESKHFIRSLKTTESYNPWDSETFKKSERNITAQSVREQMQGLRKQNPNDVDEKTIEEERNNKYSSYQTLKTEVQELQTQNPNKPDATTLDETKSTNVAIK